MGSSLGRVILEPAGEARFSVIWLHGLGADGHDFVPLVRELDLKPELGVRFIFPHAPSIPVSINNGMTMPAWYDIRSPDLSDREDRDGLRASSKQVQQVLDAEIEGGIPSEKIYLAGFSQGGAVAAHLALRYTKPLAGLVCLSTYLVGPDEAKSEQSPASQGLAAFYGHGAQDPMVPVGRGQAAGELLGRLGLDVTWKTYPMQHEVCREEIDDVAAWLREHGLS